MNNRFALVRYLARLGYVLSLLLRVIVGLTPSVVPVNKSTSAFVRYLARFWWVLDILINVLRGGEVETMSSAMGKMIVAGNPGPIPCILCGLLDLRWKNHCINNRMEPLK